MIYVHTYYTGKFNSVKHVRVCDSFDEAFNQKKVLGGEVNAYREADESIDHSLVEYVRELIDSEVSELIDSMTCHGPGGPWEDPGSPEWDCAKVNTMNKISDIIDALYAVEDL